MSVTPRAGLQDLYHYRCVGLRAPGAAEGEGDDPPASFRCPLCCMRVRRGDIKGGAARPWAWLSCRRGQLPGLGLAGA